MMGILANYVTSPLANSYPEILAFQEDFDIKFENVLIDGEVVSVYVSNHNLNQLSLTGVTQEMY